MLSARSKVFSAMFKHDTVETRSHIVKIPDVPEVNTTYITVIITRIIYNNLHNVMCSYSPRWKACLNTFILGELQCHRM